jgi:hypothetical protein
MISDAAPGDGVPQNRHEADDSCRIKQCGGRTPDATTARWFCYFFPETYHMHDWLASALWIGMALLASLISIRVAISVALIEIVVGAFAAEFRAHHT